MRYRDWRPTAFDAPGLALPNRQDWFVVPVIRTRDDGEPITESNFAVALAMLGGESQEEDDDKPEVHRFNHWGPGWFEIVLAPPSLEVKVREIVEALETYPLLDETDVGQREYAASIESIELYGCEVIAREVEIARDAPAFEVLRELTIDDLDAADIELEVECAGTSNESMRVIYKASDITEPRDYIARLLRIIRKRLRSAA